MAPDSYTRTDSPFHIARTPTWVDVNSTTSTTEPTSTFCTSGRRRTRYYSNNSTTYTTCRGRKRLNVEEKKLLAKRKAKQISDKKSKEGVKNNNINLILKPQIEKKPLFLNHKINSNRGC